ncbi:hypothetical protein Tco_0309824 [Tanacetum coccineum]
MADQDTPPPTITAMKIPIIKKGEYDIWSMRMRQYICHTDHNLWDIIVNGDLEDEATPSGEQSSPPIPKTAKQLAARRNQERIKSILLLAIPDEYLLKFTMFLIAKSYKAYDRFQKLISQLEIHGAYVSKEDINQKFLRSLPPQEVYEDELKRSSGSNSASQNLAFLSYENTNNTNEVSTASRDFGVSTAGGINQVPSTPNLEGVKEEDLMVTMAGAMHKQLNLYLSSGITNEATIVKPKSVNETVVSKSKINRNEVIIVEWTSDDEEDVCAVKIVSSVEPNVTQAVRSQADKSDCDFYKSPEPRVKNVVNTGDKVVKPVWDYGKRGNLEILLQDHAVVDSGCSSHMTGNKAYLSNYEDFNRGFMAFGSDPKGGTQDSYVAGSLGKDKGPTQEYILLPLQPHRIRFPVKDVVQDAQAQTSKNASSDKDIQDSEDVFAKDGQHQMPEDEQIWQDELEMMVTQELVANANNDESRQAFEEEKRRISFQKKATQATSTNQLSTDRPFVSTDRSFVGTNRSNTPNVSADTTSIGENADESSFVYLGGKIPIDASTLPNADLPIDPNMPDLEDASVTLLNDGIFNEAYDDDEDVGAVADFNNMDNTIAVKAFSDIDYAGASLDKKSITGGCQFLGRRLISWQCKKQTIVANSTTEAEYVATAHCCGKVLWITKPMDGLMALTH